MEMLILYLSLALLLQLTAIFIVIWVGVNRWLSSVCIVTAVVAGALLNQWSLVFGIPIILTCLLFLIPQLRQVISGRVYDKLAAKVDDINSTERMEIEFGRSWWGQDLFIGQPNWEKLSEYENPILSDEERFFLGNEVEVLCGMLNEWDINQNKDLSAETWSYIKKNKFLGLTLPKYFGGLGFSPYAQSRIISKIASRSSAAAMTCMSINFLGPSELLINYGTNTQKHRWLPRFANGNEIPCFGLTDAELGSNSRAVNDSGIVCYGLYHNKQVLGIELNFSKNSITLAPIATVVGLMFKLYDPDNLLTKSNADDFKGADLFTNNTLDYGITCALVPTDHEGIVTSTRHNPTGSAFMNGTVKGENVFIPIDFIIGGAKNIGKGWEMLVDCLSHSRGISAPALSTAIGEMSYLNVSAFTKIREQCNTFNGKCEGVQESTSTIASNTYMLEAMRHFVISGLNEGESTAVMTAIAKHYTTESMRESINHSMDILGERGIQQGPRNFVASAYQSMPVSIMAGGSNPVTRSLMIFAKEAMRYHPYLYDKLKLLQGNNRTLARQQFDKLFMSHLCYSLNSGATAFMSGIFGGSRNAPNASDKFSIPFYRHINRLSTCFAFTADFVLVRLSSDVKHQEMVSGRLADIQAHLLIMTAVLQFYANGKHSKSEQLHARVVLEKSLYVIQESFFGLFDNLADVTGISSLSVWILKNITFFNGRDFTQPSDQLKKELAHKFLQDGENNPFREQLKAFVFYNTDAKDPSGKLENAYQKFLEIEPLWTKFKKAEQLGVFAGLTFEDHIVNAVRTNFISTDEAETLLNYNGIRYDAMLTDLFDDNLQQVVSLKNPHNLINAMESVTEYVDSINLKTSDNSTEAKRHQKMLKKQKNNKQTTSENNQTSSYKEHSYNSYLSEPDQQEYEGLTDRIPYDSHMKEFNNGISPDSVNQMKYGHPFKSYSSNNINTVASEQNIKDESDFEIDISDEYSELKYSMDTNNHDSLPVSSENNIAQLSNDSDLQITGDTEESYITEAIINADDEIDMIIDSSFSSQEYDEIYPNIDNTVTDFQELQDSNVMSNAVYNDEPELTPDSLTVARKIRLNPDHGAFEQMVHDEVSKDRAGEAMKINQSLNQPSQKPLDPVDIINMRRQQKKNK